MRFKQRMVLFEDMGWVQFIGTWVIFVSVIATCLVTIGTFTSVCWVPYKVIMCCCRNMRCSWTKVDGGDLS
jgi:hypothetical protein